MATSSSSSLFGHIQTLSKGNRRKAEEQKRGSLSDITLSHQGTHSSIHTYIHMTKMSPLINGGNGIMV
jgi:hypothetical protein